MTLTDARAALKKYFGYDTFRPGQAEIIEQLYAGIDTLVLMPTGGGKSICFQIPAVTMEGVCVVVSPLISLMKDQVEGLRGNGIAAAFLNSSQDFAQQKEVEDKLFAGEVKLLYVSPEKLLSGGFLTMCKSLKISLFAIDEAHCISAWGHDFRPEYTQLKIIREQFPGTPIVALTATADKITRRDIATQLGLREPFVHLASFDRPNLSLTVRPGQKRFEQLMDFLKNKGGQSGIVYCLSRNTCEQVAEKLRSKGIPADHYHAGLEPRKRAQVQEDFINDRTPVIVATIAFGMGIDKSNVRWVVHWNLPKNIEGYYQEIGRGGRDGLPTDTLLFSSWADLTSLREMLSKDEIPAAQRELQLAKLDRMFEYAEAKICRRRMLLAYFSENFDRNCGNCDVCKHPPQYIDGTVIAQKALSAVHRCGEKVGMNLLIDVLRGSNRQEILRAGFDKIKTFGAGREFSVWEWTAYLGQLLQLGLLEVAYDQGNVLRLTEAANAVLFEKKPVSLVRPMTKMEKDAEAVAQKLLEKTQSKPVAERARPEFLPELFERLRVLRREVAQKNSVPPYIVFGDATLQEMAARRPHDEAAMMQVPGMGEKKWELYGKQFLEAIVQFSEEKELPRPVSVQAAPPPTPPRPAMPKPVTTAPGPARLASPPGPVAAADPAAPKPRTFDITFDLFKQGKNVEAIALERGLSPTTIVSHLATVYERGGEVPIDKWVRAEELDIICGSLPNFEKPYQLSHIFDHFAGRYSYEQIRLSVAHAAREGAAV